MKDDFMAEAERRVFSEIYKNRRAKRSCNPERPDRKCQCHICRWSGRIEQIKSHLSKEDADLIEDMMCAIADAETEAQVLRARANGSWWTE